MSLPDSSNLAASYCPGCRPEVDATQVIAQVRWCETHEPSRVGADDARAGGDAGYLSGTAEAGGPDNRRWCALVHSGALVL